MSTNTDVSQTAGPAPQPVERRTSRQFIGRWFATYYPLVILAVLLVIAALSSDAFLSPQNLYNLIRQVSVTGIVALGMLLVIATGGIDLSVGSIVALCAVLCVGLGGSSTALAFVIALAVGAGVGLINGGLIALRGIEPFIMTLGMLALARGLAAFYTQGSPLQPSSDTFGILGRGTIAGFPIIGLFWFGVIALVAVILRSTVFGRQVFALGSNPAAARSAGLPIRFTTVTVYVLSGLVCGLGGFLLASRTGAGTASMGEGYELEAIAAVVIGGARLSGGRGTVWGTVVGTIIFGVISNLMNLLNVSTFLQGAFRGALIIIVVLIGTGTARKAFHR